MFKGIVECVVGKGLFYYSRFFVIGLFWFLECVNVFDFVVLEIVRFCVFVYFL